MDKSVLREITKWKGLERLANPDSYNEGIRNSWMPFWTKNAAENYSVVKEDFRKENCDVSVIPKSEKPVLVIGSGPSLNEWEPYLKDWEGDIFCSSSHLAFFEAIEVKPTYCFIIDADPNMSFLVTEADTKDITLVTHANMDPLVLRSWQGPRRYFRMNDPGDPFFSEIMPMMYEGFSEVKEVEAHPEDRIWNGASGQFMGEKKDWPGIKCFVLNSGNVTNTQIALSQFMGAGRPVFLAGVDLGFPDGEWKDGAIEAWNKRAMEIVEAQGKPFDDEGRYDEWHSTWDTWQYRFLGYKRTSDGFEREEKTKIPPTRLLKEGNNHVKTDQVSCFYKYSTLILWGMDGPDIYSCSKGLLNDLLLYLPPKEVSDCRGYIPQVMRLEQRQKYNRAQEYLRHRGIYIMKGAGRAWKRASTPAKFVRSKKRLIKYLLFTNKFNKKNKMTRRQIIHGVLPMGAVKYRLKWFEWTFTPTEKVTVLLGYMGITNKYHVKGMARLKLVVKFYAGRLIKSW